MSSSDDIRKRARRLVKKAGTRDPFRLAELLDIEVRWQNFVTQRGAVIVILDQAFIELSNDLDEKTARLVCAHELAHCVLHKHLAEKSVIQEYDLFSMATDTEYEANEFASEILISTSEVRELLSQGMDVYSCAAALDTNVNMLLVKLAGMNLGRELPFKPGKAFMGGVKEDCNGDYGDESC